MPEPKRLLKVFLCHARADKQKVRELYRYLRRRGIRPWFDEIDLVGGQDWQVEIPKALATSDAIIICLTKNSVDKEGYIQKEIKFALDKALEMPEGRIFLIPVRFEECEVPFSLSRYQWVDLFDEVGYTRMMKALKFRASQLERATVELPKPPLVIEEDKPQFEKNEQNSIEEAVREEAEREAVDKAEREKAEREANERIEREKAEKAARDKLEREASEKALLEKAQREIDKRIKEARRRFNRELFLLNFRNKLNLFSIYFRAYIFPGLLTLGAVLGVLYFRDSLFANIPAPTQTPTNDLALSPQSGITPTEVFVFTEILTPSSTPTKSLFKNKLNSLT